MRIPLLRLVLGGADLSGASLQNVTAISGAIHLTGVKLPKANLSNSNFRKACLSRADLSEAQLVGTQLIETQALHARFYGANFSQANLAESDIRGSVFDYANLNSAILRDVTYAYNRDRGANSSDSGKGSKPGDAGKRAGSWERADLNIPLAEILREVTDIGKPEHLSLRIGWVLPEC